MFGTLRFVLAVMVVLQHLGGIRYIGDYAVFGFFILSGYLMTLVMHRSYGFTATGLKHFVTNRALRIFPTYYVSALLALGVLLIGGNHLAARLSIYFQLPKLPSAILQNLALLNLSWNNPTQLVPQAWSLAIELTFYLLIALVLGRTRRTTTVWFAASLAITFAAYMAGDNFSERFRTLTAGSLPFSTGAMMFHYRDALRPLWRRRYALVPILVALYGMTVYTVYSRPITATRTTFYASYAILTLLIGVLMFAESSPVLGRLDRVLGDLSYPVYLTHRSVAAVVLALSPWHLFTAPFVAAAFVVTLAVSAAIHSFIERPIERVRAYVRSGTIGEEPEQAGPPVAEAHGDAFRAQ